MTASPFKPGQRVHVTGAGPGVVLEPSPLPGRLRVRMDGGTVPFVKTCRPDQLSPLALEDTPMTTTTEQPAKKTRKARTKKAESEDLRADGLGGTVPGAADELLPPPGFEPNAEVMFQPFTFVAARIEGEDAHAMCTHVGQGGRLGLIFRNNEGDWIPAADCRVTSLPPRAPLQVGDGVTCIDRETFPGQYVVLGIDGDTVKVEHVWGGQASQRTFQAGTLLVFRRKDSADARIDLGLPPLPRPDEAEEPTGPATEEELDGYLYGVPDQVLFRPGTRVEFALGVEGRGTVITAGKVMGWYYGEGATEPVGVLVATPETEEFAEDWEEVAFDAPGLRRLEDQGEISAELPASPLQPGQQVTVMAGDWRGALGTVREVHVGEAAVTVQRKDGPSARLPISSVSPLAHGWGEKSGNDVPEAAAPTPELTPVDVVAVPVQSVALPSDVPTVPDLAPGTLGILQVPLHQLVRSGCNVRSHYDPAAVEELAASLATEGQLENCTGRWNAEGQVEVVAGETRRRAWLHLQEQGRVGESQPVLVHVRELTDAQALRISATENMRRRNMTPLEECEAMLRMHQAGDSVEEIQATFGYKTAQPVADRILVARNLHSTAREALDQGELSLAQAFVIARAPGVELQQSMTRSATGYTKTSAAGLARMLTQGEFLAKHARFDVEKSGLEVRKDLFDTFEAYFADKAKALNLQIEWVKAKAGKLRAKGKHEFVHVVTDGQFERYGRGPYTGWADDGKGGLVFVLNPHTGEVSQEERVQLRASATDGGEQPQKVREISDGAYQEAHELRARALRESVLGNTHLTLALTVWGLILGGQPGSGRAKLAELNGLPEKAQRAELMPELHARAVQLGEILAPIETKSQAYHAVLHGKLPDAQALLRLLIDTPDETLLEYLNTLVSVTAYDWSIYDNKRAAAAEYALLASLTDAPQRLAASFKLTDDWLKRYPRHELVALAEEAGLGRALVEDCTTQKQMRGRIMEHAERLHTEGFVPKMVRFPEVG